MARTGEGGALELKLHQRAQWLTTPKLKVSVSTASLPVLTYSSGRYARVPRTVRVWATALLRLGLAPANRLRRARPKSPSLGISLSSRRTLELGEGREWCRPGLGPGPLRDPPHLPGRDKIRLPTCTSPTDSGWCACAFQPPGAPSTWPPEHAHTAQPLFISGARPWPLLPHLSHAGYSEPPALTSPT